MAIHQEDKRLAERLLAGDELAFARFFEENFSRLYRFVLARLARDEEAARDVVQSALTKAVRKIHTYRGESALFTWLCVICRNELNDWMRKHASYRRHLVLIEDRPEVQAAIDSYNAAEPGGPAEELRRGETVRLIHVALDSIPAHYGNALEWKYIEGHSVKEIARRLDVSYEAAQSLMARAKRAFREVYSTLTEPAISPLTGSRGN